MRKRIRERNRNRNENAQQTRNHRWKRTDFLVNDQIGNNTKTLYSSLLNVSVCAMTLRVEQLKRCRLSVV